MEVRAGIAEGSIEVGADKGPPMPSQLSSTSIWAFASRLYPGIPSRSILASDASDTLSKTDLHSWYEQPHQASERPER